MIRHLHFYFRNPLSRTVGLVFFCNSLLFGNWVTRIPSVKATLGLTEAELGLALLGAPIGALCIMPVSGWIISRLGLGRTIGVSTLFHTLSLPFLALAGNFWELAGGLVLFGFTNSLMDISMNAGSTVVEKQLREPIVSSCHGMWSFGAMAGSGLGSIAVGFGMSTVVHLSLTVLLVLGLLAFLFPTLLQINEEKRAGDRLIAIPNASLLLLAFMGFCIMVSEGGIADWSAVYMRDTLQANAFLTGIAYAGYSLAMALGRMLGDSVIPRVGKRRVVLWGALLSATGLGISLFFSQPLVAILGFTVAGVGYACIVPVLFITAANEPGYSPGAGIASVTIISYSGFLVGPPLIGFLAEAYGLNVGLGFIVVCSAMVALISTQAKFK